MCQSRLKWLPYEVLFARLRAGFTRSSSAQNSWVFSNFPTPPIPSIRINHLTLFPKPFSGACSLASRLQLGMALPSASSAARLWKSDENVQFKKFDQNCHDSTRRQHRVAAHGTIHEREFSVQCPGADRNFSYCINFWHDDHDRNRSAAAGNTVA